HGVTSMNERRALAGGANDALWHPQDIDHAPGQHLGGGTVDAYLSRTNPCRQQRSQLPQSRRERPRWIGVRRRLSHPRELNPELVMEPIQKIDVDPTQRVEYLNGCRIRLKNADPSRADFLFKGTHDRFEELFLRSDQPIDGAGAKTRRGRDVPDGGDFITSATELRSCHLTDVARFVIGIRVALVRPRLDDSVCGCEGAGAIQLRIAVRSAGEPLQQDSAEDRGGTGAV